MQVTVFGGSGFLGSHVCDKLSEAGHAVTIFDIHPSPWLKPGQNMVTADVLDRAAVDAAVRGADVVLNYAGIADIGQANQSIVRTTELNVLGNSLILDACVRCSKQACELFIEHCQATYGLEYTILRYGSLYGPRSDSRNAIYRFVREALEGRRISYFGHPTALREYVHVEDAARVTLEILEPQFANQNIIITGNQPMQVGDLLRMLSEMLGGGIEFEFLDEGATGHYEITPYSFSPKIGRKLTPHINIDLGQGLLKVIEDVHRELHPELTGVQDLLLEKDESR